MFCNHLSSRQSLQASFKLMNSSQIWMPDIAVAQHFSRAKLFIVIVIVFNNFCKHVPDVIKINKPNFNVYVYLPMSTLRLLAHVSAEIATELV